MLTKFSFLKKTLFENLFKNITFYFTSLSIFSTSHLEVYHKIAHRLVPQVSSVYLNKHNLQIC